MKTFLLVAFILLCVGAWFWSFHERYTLMHNTDRVTRAKAERWAAEQNRKLPKDSCSRWVAVDKGPDAGWVPYLDESRCDGVLSRDLERLEGGLQR
jgi:hypothetical protein